MLSARFSSALCDVCGYACPDPMISSTWPQPYVHIPKDKYYRLLKLTFINLWLLTVDFLRLIGECEAFLLSKLETEKGTKRDGLHHGLLTRGATCPARCGPRRCRCGSSPSDSGFNPMARRISDRDRWPNRCLEALVVGVHRHSATAELPSGSVAPPAHSVRRRGNQTSGHRAQAESRVMVHPIEELFQVAVDDNASALSHMRPRGKHRIVRTAPRTEVVRGLGEACIEQRHQHLMYGLLDQPIARQSGWDALSL